jgi:hypothetical protein
MQQSPGRRALALVVALALATAGSAFAQDTTETGRAAIDTTEPGVGAIDTAGTDTVGTDTVATDTSGVRDTTDTSGVQNPPGYRGMERDTTMFPDKAGKPATPDEVEDQTTGTYEDSAWRDTSGAEQNPPGYRGMERPVEGDTAAGHTGHDTTAVGAGDTTAQTPDSAQ